MKNLKSYSSKTYAKAAKELRAHAKRAKYGKRAPLSYETSQISQLLLGGDHFGDAVCHVCQARAKACDAIAVALKKYEMARASI